MILSRDKTFLSQNLSHHAATFILTYEVKLNVFSVLNVSLKSSNIYQRAMSQNIAQLHYIDLYGQYISAIR